MMHRGSTKYVDFIVLISFSRGRGPNFGGQETRSRLIISRLQISLSLTSKFKENIEKNSIDQEIVVKILRPLYGFRSNREMLSDEPNTTKDGLVHKISTVEDISLNFSTDSNVESVKATPGILPGATETEKCNNLGTTENDLNSCVLKDLVVCTSTSSTTVLSPSSQILSSLDAIANLSHAAVNFDASTTTEMLVEGIRTAEVSEFVDGQIPSGETEIATVSLNSNPDLPPWAARLKDCEMIGDSYRGYVNTETELDLLLGLHKEHTRSFWGTRQSPSSAKPSVRLMWKSQYVPYDGIPFLNSGHFTNDDNRHFEMREYAVLRGRRATVMECQYGPRRKGNKVKVELSDDGQQVKKIHRPTCPARIYIKRVYKFPEYRIDPNFESLAGTRHAQERALTALRRAGLDNKGEERLYVQLPLEIAHEYHQDDDELITHQAPLILPDQISSSTRLDCRVVEKINELVARGVTGVYEVKHGIINFVERELFDSSGDKMFPPRHNKIFYPTITDLQNHIHDAKLALEAGTLEALPPPDAPPKVPRRDERNRKRKRSEPRRVRTPKAFETIGTICVQADQLEMDDDGNIREPQASLQVTSANEQMAHLEGSIRFVMVPSTNSLFTTTDSGIGSSLTTDKTTSLVQMQVVTVPTSTYIGQQADGSLGLAGQYLSLPVTSLPVVSYGDNQQISTCESETVVDPLVKDIASLIQSSIDEQTIQPQTSLHHTSDNHTPTTTSTTPISPRAIAMVTPDITICENRSEPTILNTPEAFTKSKEPVMLDTIDKNSTVEYLFSGSEMTKSDSEFSTGNTDMNSIPCYTEESYNSSLDIIKTHDEITTAPSNFSVTTDDNDVSSKGKARGHTSSIEEELQELESKNGSSDLL